MCPGITLGPTCSHSKQKQNNLGLTLAFRRGRARRCPGIVTFDRIGWLITLGAGFSSYGEDEADDSEDRSSSRLTNPAPRFFACSGWIRHKFAYILNRAPNKWTLKPELRYRRMASRTPARLARGCPIAQGFSD
jgi:hypothetical protein